MEAAKKKEEEEAAPTFSEEELQAARDEAYQQGLQAGLQEAHVSIEQQVSSTLEVIGATIGQISEQQSSANELISRETVDLAVAIAQKLLPGLTERGGVAEVETFASDIMQRLLEEPRLTIRVAENLAPELERQLLELKNRIGFAGELSVFPDSELGPADCRIRWGEGEAERIVEATMNEIASLTNGLSRPMTEPLEIAPAPQVPIEDADHPEIAPAPAPELEPAPIEAAAEPAELEPVEAIEPPTDQMPPDTAVPEMHADEIAAPPEDSPAVDEIPAAPEEIVPEEPVGEMVPDEEPTAEPV